MIHLNSEYLMWRKCGYFFIGFINFILKSKSCLDYNFSRYTKVAPLKDKKGITATNAF